MNQENILIKEVNWQIISSVLRIMKLKNIKTILTKLTLLIVITAVVISGTGLCTESIYAQEMAKERSFPNANKAKNEEPVTLGTAACLIDAKTGYVIYAVDEHEQNYPASTTKIMTALLALENLNMEDIVTVDEEAALQGGSQLYLSPGEKISVNSLIYGLMLPSANDAAIALAHAISPNTQEFAQLMNEKAESVGAMNTNFVNPNGLPDDKHYTSAYDLAMIAREAMKYDEFRKIVTTYEYTLPKTNKEKKRLIHNRNRLLYNINRKVEAYGETKSIKYDGVTGIKTGYTNKAKFCLVGSAKRGDTELIAVTMKSEDMNGYQDVVSMLDYGFNNYKTVEIKAPGGKIKDVKVDGGVDKYADAEVADGLYVTMPSDGSKEGITFRKKYEDIDAPYKAGFEAGTIEVYYDNEKISESKVTVVSAMREGTIIDDIKTGSGFFGILFKVLMILAIILIVFVVIVLILRTWNKGRVRRRRAKRRRAKNR